MTSSQLSPQQAAQELLARRASRSSLLSFTRYTKPDYITGWFAEQICLALEQFYADVVAGKSPRLMIAAPPRHGKSEIVSRRFPAWVHGLNPDLDFIGTAYGSTLAVDNCRDVQRVIDSIAYRNVFPETLLSGKNVRETSLGSYKRTSDEYEVVGHTGRYLAAGVGTGITGKGADIGIIDDPVKDSKEADSLTVQVANWDWYTKTFRSRISPGGGILYIGTRWNVNDLAGYILKNEGSVDDGGIWKVLTFPAVATQQEEFRGIGEALHPERWPLEALEGFRTPAHSWASLYQQEPYIRGGNMIKGHWLKIVDDFPRNAKGARYWDLAGTEASGSKDPDYTAGAQVHYVDGQWFITGMERFRETPLVNENRIRATAERDGRAMPVYIQQDPGQAGKSQISHYARNVLSGFAFKGHNKGSTSKTTLAEPLASAAEAGNVFIVRRTNDGYGLTREEIDALLSEIEVFPKGAHDDQVDAITGAIDRLSTKKESGPMYGIS